MLYKKGKIYKIVHNQSNLCYVGSTFDELRNRWQNHKRAAKCDKQKPCCIHKYLQQYGPENFKCILIKEYNVVDKYHLRAYEQLWINKLNSINIKGSIPMLDFIKKKEDKNYRKKYFVKNKKKIYEYQSKRGKINKILCECGAYVRSDGMNVHKTRTKHLNYIKKVNNYKSGQIQCNCGCYISNKPYNINRHKQSKKHIAYLDNIDKSLPSV